MTASADIKQLPGLKKTKMVMHSITSKGIQLSERLVRPRPIK